MSDNCNRIVDLSYATEASLKVAQDFANRNLNFAFNELEETILSRFFSNLNKRVVFIKNLPPGITASLISMYSRMKNPRGIRGVFLDSFLPSILSGGLSNVLEDERWKENISEFLTDKNVKCLEDFSNLSLEAEDLIKAFSEAFKNLQPFNELMADSQKAKKFIQTWLEKYGHNSIGRMAGITFCIEGCSMLTAKSIEWCRPGIGFVELSSRYVDLKKASCYPIFEELDALGFNAQAAKELNQVLFDYYRSLQGEKQDGYFPNFLREKYKNLFKGESDEKLIQGIFGECCDVGGNFLPLCTLTSVGVQASGEAFSMLLKHLLLDATSENIALVELIKEEAKKVGVDQFFGHFKPSEAEKRDWRYLESKQVPLDYLEADIPPEGWAKKTLERAFGCTGIPRTLNTLEKIPNYLYEQDRRNPGSFRKLPAEFELVSVAFYGAISIRSHRDLQRMGFSTHNRSLVTAELGFYHYPKEAPHFLTSTFQEVEKQSRVIYNQLKESGCHQNPLQYILPMGFLVNFMYACNLRQLEFSIWQRTKPSVNHEVRTAFLNMEHEIRKQYPWWSHFSRCDTTPEYLFARGGSNIAKEKTNKN